MSLRSDPAPVADDEGVAASTFRLSEAQKAFFEAFGFLLLPGVFADDIEELTAAFEDVFGRHPAFESHEDLHFNDRRMIIAGFAHQHPRLEALYDDPRVVDIVSTLISPDYVACESDASLFYCDTSWHADTFGSPLDVYHVKLSFYLDPLVASTGAIRMIPGTHKYDSPYAALLRDKLSDHAAIERFFGVPPQGIPAWALETRPGDLVVWNMAIIHASFGGDERRRLFSLNFKEPDSTA
jgi:ectoine hydroxylase-related dioxygenase (phytanoyl-CoA dioxygenase family)